MTPLLSVADHRGQELKLDDLDFLGRSAVSSIDNEAGSKTNTHITKPMQSPFTSGYRGSYS